MPVVPTQFDTARFELVDPADPTQKVKFVIEGPVGERIITIPAANTNLGDVAAGLADHASTHLTGGGDAIPPATVTDPGLMTTAQVTALGTAGTNATTALANAATANGAAATALAAAVVADDKADAAQTTAGAAQTDATQALADAATAQTDATQALADAATATADAAAANDNANAVALLPGRYLSSTTLTAASGTHTVSANTSKIRVRVQAGGGGGGGCGTAAVQSGGGGGGSAGGYAEKVFAVDSGTGYSYTVGVGGTGGLALAGTGVTGNNSTFVVGGVTVTAFGGLGGVGVTAAANSLALGGASPAVSTIGDVNGAGQPGGYGLSMTAAVGVSGQGGSCLFGAGGASRKTQGDGLAGVGRGAGGGGGCSINGGISQAGAAGLAGVIVVDEFF